MQSGRCRWRVQFAIPAEGPASQSTSAPVPTALCPICNVTSRNLSLTGAPHVTIYYIRALHIARAAGYRHRLERKYNIPLALTHATVSRWERTYRPPSAPCLLWADVPPLGAPEPLRAATPPPSLSGAEPPPWDVIALGIVYFGWNCNGTSAN